MAVVLEVEWVIASLWLEALRASWVFFLAQVLERHHVVKFQEFEHETPSFSI